MILDSNKFTRNQSVPKILRKMALSKILNISIAPLSIIIYLLLLIFIPVDDIPFIYYCHFFLILYLCSRVYSHYQNFHYIQSLNQLALDFPSNQLLNFQRKEEIAFFLDLSSSIILFLVVAFEMIVVYIFDINIFGYNYYFESNNYFGIGIYLILILPLIS